MPTYDFKNTETGEIETKFLSLKQREEYLKENTHMVQCLTTPNIGDPVRLGVTKTPESFDQLLKAKRKAHRRSTIQTRN